MRFLQEDTLAVVIDIQEKLFPSIDNKEKLVENSIKLLSGLNVLEIPILITEQYTKGLGKTIPEIKTVIEKDYHPIEKMDFSCCGENDFMTKLKNLNKKNILLLGIESHVCVLQTALDLIAEGFNVIVVEDCVASRKINDKKIALKRMSKEGATLTTYESILLELCKKSGTDKFKAISKIIK